MNFWFISADCQFGFFLVLVGVSIVSFIVLWLTYRNKKRTYHKWNTNLFRFLLLTFTFVLIVVVSLSLLANIIYRKNMLVLESDLNDKEGFAIVVGLATLITTILIAIFQYFNQKNDVLLTETIDFKNRLETLLTSKIDLYLYTLKSEDVKQLFSCYDISSYVNTKYMISLSFAKNFSLLRAKLDGCCFKDLKQSENAITNKNENKKIDNQQIIDVYKKVYLANKNITYFFDTTKQNEFIENTVLPSFFSRQNEYTMLELYFHDASNPELKAKITLQFALVSWHEKDIKKEIDGKCKLEITDVYCEII